MIIRKIILILFVGIFIISNDSQAWFGKSKQKKQDVCAICKNQRSVCSPEHDKVFRHCLKNCSKQIDVNKMCEGAGYFMKMRSILSYENTVNLNTNEITKIALDNLDMAFIKQTVDRKRLIGTAKKILLVYEQYIKGNNIQKLSPATRKALAEKLLREYFVHNKEVLGQYDTKGTILDIYLAALFDDLKRQILSKYKRVGFK